MSQSYTNTTYMDAVDINSGDATGAGLDVHDLKTISFIAVAAGSTPAGVYKVQASNDNSTWALTGTTSTISGDATTLITITDFGSKYVRLWYDRSSGGAAGGLSVSVNAC